MSDRRRHGFVLLVVAGLLAASIVALFTAKTELGLDLRGGVQLVYRAAGTPQHPRVDQADLDKAVTIMQARVDALGANQPQIETSGGDEISASLPAVHDVRRAEQLVGSTSRLLFYDWEANAITSSGRSVAGQLLAQNPDATLISQGSRSTAPGDPGAGSMGLYAAVRLASRQPTVPLNATTRQYLSRGGRELFLFGAPGSAACARMAHDTRTEPVSGEHCYLAGGEDTSSRAELASELKPGVHLAGNELLGVPQGWVVLQAAQTSPDPGEQVKLGAPSAQFYVLHDHVALTGDEITNPQASTAQGGQPDVQFGFTSRGARAFQTATAVIAHRGRSL